MTRPPAGDSRPGASCHRHTRGMTWLTTRIAPRFAPQIVRARTMPRARTCCGSKNARNLPEVPALPTPDLINLRTGKEWPHLPRNWRDLLSPETTDLGKRQRGILGLLVPRYGTDLLPTNGRFTFYEGEQDGWVAKKRFCSACGKPAVKPDSTFLTEAAESLRSAEITLYEWYTDETRSLTEYVGHAEVEAAVRGRLDTWWMTPWNKAHPEPLALFESRSLNGTMRRHLAERHVPHTAFNGQSGAVHLHNEVAPWLRKHPESPVLYFGDLDLAGAQIEDWARDVLTRKAPGWSGDWKRVAITVDQVPALLARGMSPIVKKDERYVPARTVSAWETEALGQAAVRDILIGAIDALMPMSVTDLMTADRRETALMDLYLDGYAAWKAAR